MLAALVAISTAAAAPDFDQLLKDRGQAVSARFTVSVPQTELDVTLDGFTITPAMGLTTTISFEPSSSTAVAWGDLALLEEEVRPAQRLVAVAGFEVQAVRHPFLRETPKVALVGVRAGGELADLTERARRLLAGLQELRAAKRLDSRGTVVPSSLDKAALERLLELRGVEVGGVLRFADGERWAAFQGSMEKAAAAGRADASDAARLADEGFEIASLDGRFAHFWAVGPAEKLARALKTRPRGANPAARIKP